MSVKPISECLNLWQTLPDFQGKSEPNHGQVLQVFFHHLWVAPNTSISTATHKTTQALEERWKWNGLPTMTSYRVYKKILGFHQDFFKFKKIKPSRKNWQEKVRPDNWMVKNGFNYAPLLNQGNGKKGGGQFLWTPILALNLNEFFSFLDRILF